MHCSICNTAGRNKLTHCMTCSHKNEICSPCTLIAAVTTLPVATAVTTPPVVTAATTPVATPPVATAVATSPVATAVATPPMATAATTPPVATPTPTWTRVNLDGPAHEMKHEHDLRPQDYRPNPTGKIRQNADFAAKVSLLPRRGKIVIIEAWGLYTTTALLDMGVEPQRITVVNFKPREMAAMLNQRARSDSRYGEVIVAGLHSQGKFTFGLFIKTLDPGSCCAIFADYCATPKGNKNCRPTLEICELLNKQVVVANGVVLITTCSRQRGGRAAEEMIAQFSGVLATWYRYQQNPQARSASMDLTMLTVRPQYLC